MKKLNFRKIASTCSTGLIALFCSTTASAAASTTGLMNSGIYTGTVKLIADIMTAVTILCPSVCGVAAVIFAIRRGMADEQESKTWNRRITTAIVCGVLGGLISGIIALVASYYSV